MTLASVVASLEQGSSESDSESESSSSESESSKQSACTSPEPQHSTAHKWQLDKWLNKVNPNKTSILSQPLSLNHGGVNEGEQGCEKASQVDQESPSHKDDRSPTREERSIGATCTVIGNRGVKLRSPPPGARAATVVVAVPSENTSRRTPACRKLTRRTERTSSGDDLNCHKLDHALTQGILGSEISEQTKNKLTCYSRGLHRKESRATLFDYKKRRTQITRSVPKCKENIELSLQSSDHSTETESNILPFCKNNPAFSSESSQRYKESGNNNIKQASTYNTQDCISRRTTSEVAPELEEQFYTLVPFGRNDCSVKGNNDIKALWVQIDLMLLSRIPHSVPQENLNMNNSKDKILTPSPSKCLLQTTDNPSMKMRRKRKYESEGSQEMKKNPLEKKDSLQFPVESLHAASIESLELKSFEMSLSKPEKCLSPLPFFPDEPNPNCTSEDVSSAQKCDKGIMSTYASCNLHYQQEKHSHARQRSQPSNNTRSVYNKDDLDLNHWSPALNGHTDTRITKQLLESTRPHNADYFMQEAKRMKHKADAMVDKFDKVLNYIEAALAFIECGNALEHGPVESKSPYTMYSETVELIRYALRLNSHLSHSASTQDKKITALCYRCLALLYWRMFRLKRDHAVKYSKALIDYFKNSSKGPRVPSPWNANGKTTGTASPMSSTLSPVSSQGSISSSGAASSSSSIISIPQRIHQMAANHVSITNSILHSYDYWEIADNLAKENTEFFTELDSSMGPITLHSSMEHLVQYTRQGLTWIRHSSHQVI
ncbi:hypothetical protein GDO78_000834 [Eleutherodactylus coqui]|uniref:AF4/FMR2 C-terminal homology domain-containing protein n=2 Tax=Eleutherodactylus coqui TaxID=57060 RepID=A0A8J6FQA7_ELECQ|nr:hypothetical protein GDO78_000834 [Eleutherodactylus coqui]KAG9492549.1 hypothetical protein GDO78_000834 [Eleutherodactylus coqui]